MWYSFKNIYLCSLSIKKCLWVIIPKLEGVVPLSGRWVGKWKHTGQEGCDESDSNSRLQIWWSVLLFPGNVIQFSAAFSVLGSVGVEELGFDSAVSKLEICPDSFFSLLYKAGPSDVIGTCRCLCPLLWQVPRKTIFVIKWYSFPNPDPAGYHFHTCGYRPDSWKPKEHFYLEKSCLVAFSCKRECWLLSRRVEILVFISVLLPGGTNTKKINSFLPSFIHLCVYSFKE